VIRGILLFRRTWRDLRKDLGEVVWDFPETKARQTEVLGGAPSIASVALIRESMPSLPESVMSGLKTWWAAIRAESAMHPIK